MASNASSLVGGLPSLPPYTLRPLPPLIEPIPDKYLTLLVPILAYWALSMIFHYIDTQDLFPQYRLHTPAEVLKRNHVSRWEVVRDVLIQQVVQTVVGVGLALAEPQQMAGQDDYNVAVWAQRLRIAQHALPTLLFGVGIDSKVLATRISGYSPILASILSGGQYPELILNTPAGLVPTFATWELATAKAIYWVGIPAMQFLLAIIIVDTWQYFLHRAMHMNKWLYVTFHSRHHRLYVPYAYGALYNHPFEGFLLDTLGTGIAYLVAGLTPRQSMWFFGCTTLKTVDDHCGYAFPWDPLQHLTTNNAGYHDVHHQSWGIKTNFSQPFFTFWDRLLGTVWTGGDVSSRYERARTAAQRQVDKDVAAITKSVAIDSILAKSNKPYDSNVESDSMEAASSMLKPQPPVGKATAQAIDSRKQILSDRKDSNGGFAVLAEETAEEERERQCLPALVRPNSKKATTGNSTPGGLKSLSHRVRSGSLLAYEAGQT